ncbi:transposase [Thiolinea disciformis]|uniref:transposase n=1 Tax=Thiolinea disciformis TaxID=125614 RepID=UPI0009FE75DE|nr:transposase [Thiolinea disciformis]
MALDVSTGYLLNTQGAEGSIHDFTLFKRTVKTWRYRPYFVMDKGYEGICPLHFKALTPIKKSKGRPLAPEQKTLNHEINRRRMPIEHAFAALKVFKILSTRYRNRRKRLLLRFNVIAGLYNRELINH